MCVVPTGTHGVLPTDTTNEDQWGPMGTHCYYPWVLPMGTTHRYYAWVLPIGTTHQKNHIQSYIQWHINEVIWGKQKLAHTVAHTLVHNQLYNLKCTHTRTHQQLYNYKVTDQMMYRHWYTRLCTQKCLHIIVYIIYI